MIILEGCDCTGKSTLATRLAEHYNSEIIHYSTHNDDDMRRHAIVGVYGTGQIVDRFHLSEPPYSMYLRHETPQYESVSAIDEILNSGKHLVILCIPPWKTVIKLWKERLDLEVVKNEESLLGIYDWYATRAERYKTPHMLYDWTDDHFDGLRYSIDKHFEGAGNGV